MDNDARHPFADLDRDLPPDYHADHWSDDAVLQAATLGLDEGAWRQLEKIWQAPDL